jgi:hypothetical protein
MRQKSMSKKGSAEKTIRNIRRKTRWHYSSQDALALFVGRENTYRA